MARKVGSPVGILLTSDTPTSAAKIPVLVYDVQ